MMLCRIENTSVTNFFDHKENGNQAENFRIIFKGFQFSEYPSKKGGEQGWRDLVFLKIFSVFVQMFCPHTNDHSHQASNSLSISRKTQKISLFLNLINKIMNDEPVLL